jgi:hypothetical protein
VLAIKSLKALRSDSFHGRQFGETPQEGQGHGRGEIVAGQRQGLGKIPFEHTGQLVGRAGALIHRAAPG